MQRRLGYSPQLDGLRAVCIAFTIVNHVPNVPGWINGTVGVDVFFALSGFLITAILMAEGVSLRSFYIRRLFRIAPVYYLAFALTAGSAWVLGGVKLQELQASWHWIAAFCGEYRPSAAGSFFGHSWTVGMEEKFYLVWPLLVLFVLRSNLAVVLFLGLIPPVMFFVGTYEFRGYGGIALGSLASICYFRYGLKPLPTLVGVGLCAGAYLAATLLRGSNILMALAAAVLIPAIYADPSSSVTRVLADRRLVWLGKLTFSIYMLHGLVINAVKIVLPKLGVSGWFGVYLASYVVSVVCAWVVYRFYEQPLIDMGRGLSMSQKPGPAPEIAAAR